MVIREAVETDADGLTVLIRELFPLLEAESPQATHARILSQVTSPANGEAHSLYVAQIESGKIVGYAAVHWLTYLRFRGPEGFVSELFVSADVRGCGAGTRLLEAVVAAGKARGCCRLHLVNMRDRESYQRQFYSSRGWEERPDAADFVYTLPAPPAEQCE